MELEELNDRELLEIYNHLIEIMKTAKETRVIEWAHRNIDKIRQIIGG